MACKLYYKCNGADYQVGTFQNRKKAEAFWNLVKGRLIDRHGADVEPIYVETGKGRGE